MVGRKKKSKICNKGSEEDLISKLPDHLMYEILIHLLTKDVVKTSLLSTRWRNIWQCIPGLDIDSLAFSSIDAFVSFGERFFDSHSHKDSWIRKLRLSIRTNCSSESDRKSLPLTWIDAVTTQRIQHLDISGLYCCRTDVIPLSIYTCHTLVHLRLCYVALAKIEFFSLPCLKILHLKYVRYANEAFEAFLEKLISGSSVLEDLTIINNSTEKVIQVRFQTLKRIHINHTIKVVIEAPLLQCLRTENHLTKNFKIINLGFSTRLDIDVIFRHFAYSKSFIDDILADISRVRDLVIRNVSWKQIFLYSGSGPLLQFRHLSRLDVKIVKSDLEKLPTILESCSKLESLILELVQDPFMPAAHKKNREPKVIVFSTVPECLVSSLKFLELKRSVSGYDGETEIIRYMLFTRI